MLADGRGFTDAEIGSEGAKAISEGIACCPSLRVLNMTSMERASWRGEGGVDMPLTWVTDNAMGDAGAKAICDAAAGGCPRLTTLYISGMPLPLLLVGIR